LEIQPETVDYPRFVSWAPTVLSDFESIVLQNHKGEDVFQKAYLLQSINRWNLKPETVKSYMEFWELLPKLFTKFYASLKKLNLQTGATAIQHAIDSKDDWVRVLDAHEMVWCGFTVFSPLELSLLHSLGHKFKIRIIYDSPLFDGVAENHESNRFLSVLQKEFENVDIITSSRSSKNLEAVECANSHSMVKQLSQILRNLSPEELHSTAVVLLDDADAPLLLNSIPENVAEFNLGIGKPFLQTTQGITFNLLLECWQTLSSTGIVQFDLVESLLRNLAEYMPELGEQVEVTIAQLVKNNVSHFKKGEELNSILTNLKLNNIGKALLQKNFSHFVNHLILNERIDFTLFQEIQAAVNQVLNTAGLKDFRVYEYLFLEKLRSLSLNIKGSPHQGLQILSLLESRVLDFKNLVFLSFNENNLPGSGSFSYVPFELQIQFGLPDQSAKEAIIAYHFMRLLKRAETAQFLYSSKESGLSSGESSRYNLQAQWEWSMASSQLNFKHRSLSASIKALQNDKFVLPKQDSIREQTKRYLFERGLSPSALNVYLSNPLDFFLMQVLGLREKVEVDSDIASFNLGEIIHGTLEESYKEHLGVTLEEKIFENLRSKLTTRIEEQIEKLFSHQLTQNAKLKILNPVVHRWINQFFEFELRRLRKEKFKVIEVERSLKIKVLNKRFPILLKGIVDRVDESPDGIRHVIDYKTGKVEPKDLKLESEELVQLNPEKTKAYQLLLYAYAYWLQYPTNKKIRCSIYSFRNQKSGLIPLLIDESEWLDKEAFQQFDRGLENVIQEMLDTETPFEYRTEGYTKFEL
jgi:RecB family exonuclease